METPFTIHKYTFAVTDRPEVRAHAGAYFLHAGTQDGTTLCVWARVDTRRVLVDYQLIVAGTGHPLHLEGDHIGAVQMPSGLVWHVFFGCIL